MSEQEPPLDAKRVDLRSREYGMFTDEEVDKLQDKIAFDSVNEKLQDPQVRAEIVRLVKKYHGGKGGTWHTARRGSYNGVFVVKFDEPGSYGMMRIPLPRYSLALREEKLRAEVAIMRYVEANTTIPVSHVYHMGMAEQNPTGLGPFIIMDYFPDTINLSDLLKDPAVPYDHDTLHLDMPEENLENLYRQMANIVLQLDQFSMPESGSLCHSDGEYTVSSRMLPQTLIDVITCGGCPESVLGPPNRVLNTSHEVYQYYADLHMAQFIFQRNDAVESEDDARDKYMARHLFRRAAYMNLLPFPSYTGRRDHITPTPETFKLICDDLTPSNVLVDPKTGDVVAVVDWEFAWFGPRSMASDPPWWLLLQKPQYWREDIPGGLEDWAARYPKYLDIFLRALEKEEQKLSAGPSTGVPSLGADLEGHEVPEPGPVAEWLDKLRIQDENVAFKCPKEPPLSARMRRNWEDGSFWINYATRRSYGFDPVYWKYIDERLFGQNPNGGYERRAGSMTTEARELMEMVVMDKMEEMNGERKVVEWFTDEARAHLARVLGYGQL
ncbi:hypothetical protein QBC40DRAFT_272579 [Triangularia verruculosa]|uniref:Aminoglycoside phosphotransferase domain-containing protein n=1 Tax=Triangularia verruculosa TaxID=2587418 RepID=A0AAN6XQ79_9PEZI|nr:hypothetical protein QBC40DRAFT_272579 [Triangularia verruculosa]